MIILSSTTDKLQAFLSGAISTNQLRCYTAFRDRTSTTFTPNRTGINTNDTTAIDLVASPAASTQRIIDFINIYNSDTANAQITIQFDDNTTSYILYRGTLAPGQTLSFVEGSGWSISEEHMPIQHIILHADGGANLTFTNMALAETLVAARTTTSIDLVGYTQARFKSNQQVTSASVNTPLLRAKYYTTYTATVGTFIQLGASAEVEFSLTGAGYKDTGWIDIAVGAQINNCFIGFTVIGGDGAADPAVGYTELLFR